MRQGQGGRAADGAHTEAGEHQEDFLCSPAAPALPLDIKPHQSALLSDKLGTNLCWGAQREPQVCCRGSSRGRQSLSISQATLERMRENQQPSRFSLSTSTAGRSCTVALMSKPRGAAAPVGQGEEQRQLRAAPLTDPGPNNCL